jgi:hypothetical protein
MSRIKAYVASRAILATEEFEFVSRPPSPLSATATTTNSLLLRRRIDGACASSSSSSASASTMSGSESGIVSASAARTNKHNHGVRPSIKSRECSSRASTLGCIIGSNRSSSSSKPVSRYIRPPIPQTSFEEFRCDLCSYVSNVQRSSLRRELLRIRNVGLMTHTRHLLACHLAAEQADSSSQDTQQSLQPQQPQQSQPQPQDLDSSPALIIRVIPPS